jgi:hypothetical protein
MKKVVFAMVFLGLILPMRSQCQAQQAVISLPSVDIYALPNADEAPVAILSRGDKIRVIGQRGNWVKIAYGQTDRGWMLISIDKPAGIKAGIPRQEEDVPEMTGHPTSESSPRYASTKNPDRLVNDVPPEEAVVPQPTPKFGQATAGRFGYSFGTGLAESDFAYNWKFIFHTTPRLAMEGSVKHILGEAADSYLIMTNFSYLILARGHTLPYLTAGVGVINTVPERSVAYDGVSHMHLNYGAGVRKSIRESLSLTFSIAQFSVFVEDGVQHFREFTVGLLVGRFGNER